MKTTVFICFCFAGIKNSLKLDEVAGGMASKLQGAKEFLAEKQHSVSESGPLRMVKEKVGNLVPQGAGAYLSEFSRLIYSVG